MDLHLKIKALFICYWDKSWIIMNIEDLKAKMRNRVCFLCPPQVSFNVYVCISSTSLYLIWAWRKPGSREPDLSKGERSIVLRLSPTGMYSIEHYSILSKAKQMGFFFTLCSLKTVKLEGTLLKGAICNSHLTTLKGPVCKM